MTFVSFVQTPSDGQGKLKATCRRRRPSTATSTQFSPIVPLPHANILTGYNKRQSLTIRNAVVMDVLGTQDLVDGTLLAFALALVFLFLQERRRDRPSPPPPNAMSQDSLSQNNTTTASNYVFDSWKEMSRQENYVYYNNKVKQQRRRQTRAAGEPFSLSVKREKTWVVVALLVLFIPIFSAEFFLALSRQVLCGGNPMTQSSWAATLCSPHL